MPRYRLLAAAGKACTSRMLTLFLVRADHKAHTFLCCVLLAAAAADASSGPFDAAQSTSGSSSSKRSAAAGPEGRHAVMQFIRAHSPEVGRRAAPAAAAPAAALPTPPKGIHVACCISATAPHPFLSLTPAYCCVRCRAGWTCGPAWCSLAPGGWSAWRTQSSRTQVGCGCLVRVLPHWRGPCAVQAQPGRPGTIQQGPLPRDSPSPSTHSPTAACPRPVHACSAALGAAPRPAVAAYFEDPRVQAFLAAEVSWAAASACSRLSHSL